MEKHLAFSSERFEPEIGKEFRWNMSNFGSSGKILLQMNIGSRHTMDIEAVKTLLVLQKLYFIWGNSILFLKVNALIENFFLKYCITKIKL